MAVVGCPSIVKAGWLYRETSVLHRWKKNWFVLYTDGILRYFDDHDSKTAETQIILRNQCIEVNSGIIEVSAPDGRDSRALFSLDFLTEGKWTLCAESEDDMKAWTMAINDMRQGGPRRHPTGYPPQAPYPMPPAAAPYYPTVPAMLPGQSVVYNSPTVMMPGMMPQTVVYAGDPLFGHHRTFGHHHHGAFGHHHGTFGNHHYYDNGLYLSGGMSSPFGPSVVSGGAVLSTPSTTTTTYYPNGTRFL